jgi:hypothetical protein
MIETLQGYLMVDHENHWVEYLERTPEGWNLTKLKSGRLFVGCLKVTLNLADIFA